MTFVTLIVDVMRVVRQSHFGSLRAARELSHLSQHPLPSSVATMAGA
jgi:hypothetical protein